MLAESIFAETVSVCSFSNGCYRALFCLLDFIWLMKHSTQF